VRFIASLCVEERRPIVVPEWPNISLPIRSDNRRPTAPEPKQYAESVAACLGALRLADGSAPTQCDIVGHSYGSIVAVYLHRHRPDIVARRVLIDPMSFGISWHWWVTFSHEYILRSTSELLHAHERIGWAETFAMWFIKGDLSVQQMGKRRTHFSQIMSSHEGGELDEDVLVVLGGKDICVPGHDIYKLAHGRGSRCSMVFEEGWGHGGFLFMPDPHGIWQRIADWVAPESERLAAAAVSAAKGGDADAKPAVGGFMRRVTSNPSLRGHLFAAGS